LNDGPVNLALANGLRGLALDGRLVSGTRVPSERELAAALGVSRSTVTAAYDRLRGEGYLRSRHGAGSIVAVPVRPIARPDDSSGSAQLLDLTVAALPAPRQLREAAAAAAVDLSRHAVHAGLQPMGLAELREAIAERYCDRGLSTRADEVLITSGALHAWDLTLRALVSPGAAVVCEQPTYPAVLDAALAHHTRVIPLPTDTSGWDPTQILRTARPPALAHITPDGQNPTGMWASDSARRRLLAHLDPATVMFVDETLIDLPFGETATRPMSAVVPRGRTVIAGGSMSKSFWAGLRVGWLRAPAELVRRIAAARAGQDIATPVLDQLVAVRLLAIRDEVLPDRRAALVKGRVALCSALAEHLPEWRAAPPQGGMSLWVDLAGASSTHLARRAREHGIRITPGTRFTVAGTHDRWTRLPFTEPPGRLHEAVRGLAAAASTLPVGRGSRRGSRGGADTAWTA
jgi:DNA-binding transcriptional MocR family regulator